MKKRLFWIALGLLLAGTLYAWATGGLDPPIELTSEDRRILIREKFVPFKVVEEIEVEGAERIVTKYKPRIQKIYIEAEPEVVTVERLVEVPAGCPDPGEGLTLGGGCEVEILEFPDETLARGWFSCRAESPLLSAQRGPVLTSTRAISTKPPPRPLPGLFELALGVTSQPGGRAEVRWYKRGSRLGTWLAVDWGPSEEFSAEVDNEYFVDAGQSDEFRVAAGASIRLGKRK